MKVSYNDLLDIYDNYIYKNCKNKRKLYMFEKFKMINLTNLCEIVNNDNYNILKYNIFLIKYPKYRVVMSLNISDKIINHYVTLNILIPKLSKYLDIRNIATRKGMGTSYGIKLLKKYLNINKKNGKFYILKLDISKYFYNIDHNVLKDLIKDKLSIDEFDIISTIINSTNYSYINKSIISLINNELKYKNRCNELNSIPLYEYDKGLPIGNMTSQFLAIFYLYKLDYYMVNYISKYMIRYMDDYVIIHNDKKYLFNCINKIEYILENKYKLKLNKNKCKIYDSVNGFDFLGRKFKVINDKIICYMSNKAYRNIKKRIRFVSKCYKFDKYFSSINNYYSIYNIRKYINFYYK